MPSRGDITASEIYADREMLNRIGYGIFDVTFSQDGIGSENIKDFSYIAAQDEDPKMYRRKVFQLIGRYYPNPLAKLLWDKFIDHKWVMSEAAGREIPLQVAAQDWFNQYSHQFLKEWTFTQTDIPYRVRNRHEPYVGVVSLLAGRLVPQISELLQSGFSIVDITKAAVTQTVVPGHWRKLAHRKGTHRRIRFVPRFSLVRLGKRVKKSFARVSRKPVDDEQEYLVIKKLDPAEIEQGRHYVQLVAQLTGHQPHSPEEAERRWSEILEHKWYMSERAGHDVGMQTAALDYFRRLNLLQESETGYEV